MTVLSTSQEWFRVLSQFCQSISVDQIGIARIGDLSSQSFYREWLDAGFAGEMDYLQTHFADRYTLHHVLNGACSVLMVRVNYYQEMQGQAHDLKIARYALGRDYHQVIKKKLKQVESQFLNFFPQAKTRICVDSVPIPERDLAYLAGLGWFGKNSCLINTHEGSWFFLGGIITDLEIEPSQPVQGGCGTCSRCIDACPTGAIVQLNGHWTINSSRCISYLTIEKRGHFSKAEAESIGNWTVGCDVCQEVCPFNQPRAHHPLRSQITNVEDFLDHAQMPNLVEMIQLSESDWKTISQGRAWKRCGYFGIVRNAKANIANQTRTSVD